MSTTNQNPDVIEVAPDKPAALSSSDLLAALVFRWRDAAAHHRVETWTARRLSSRQQAAPEPLRQRVRFPFERRQCETAHD